MTTNKRLRADVEYCFAEENITVVTGAHLVRCLYGFVGEKAKPNCSQETIKKLTAEQFIACLEIMLAGYNKTDCFEIDLINKSKKQVTRYTVSINKEVKKYITEDNHV